MDASVEIGPVESGIPIPPKKPLTVMGVRVRALRVGDSIFCGSEVLRDIAKSTARYIGIKILVRKAEGGWRVWRKE